MMGALAGQMFAKRGLRGRWWRMLPMATSGVQRRVAAVCYLIVVVGTPGWIVLAHGDHAWYAIRVAAACLLLASAVFLAPIAGVARAAQQGCWPGMRRDAALAMWVYALAGVALPVIAIAALAPGLAVLAAATLGFGMAMGLVYMLTPGKYRGAGIVAIVLLINPGFNEFIHADKTALTLAVIALCVLAAAGAMVVWRLVVTRPSWTCPLTDVEAIRRNGSSTTQRGPTWALWNAVMAVLFKHFRPGRETLVARLDVARTGPRWPVRSMRVALGGFNPILSLGARLAFITWAVLALVAIAVFLVFTNIYMPPDTARQVNRVVGTLLVLLAELACAITAIGVVGGKWHRDPDLALLALLPGLGTADAARRRLLRATLRPVLLIEALAWLAMLVTGALLQAHAWTLALMTAMAAGCTASAMAFALRVSAGWRRRRAASWTMLGLTVLFIWSMVLTLNDATSRYAFVASGVSVVAWVACCIALARSGYRAWRHWRRQPHPFLPREASRST